MKTVRLLSNLALALVGLTLVGGCHTDMWTQPKIHKPLQESDFFVDGASARLPVPHTVAAGSFTTDDGLTKGIENKKLVDVFPFPITRDELNLGRERFNIYCSPCHGRLGYGDGMIAKRGFNIRKKPGNYHTERLRKMKVGHFYDVITNGFGAMFSYSSRIQDPKDRWRIVAYIRALQLSQNAPAARAGAEIKTEELPIDTSGSEPVKK